MKNPVLRISFFGPDSFWSNDSDACHYYRTLLEGLSSSYFEITVFLPDGLTDNTPNILSASDYLNVVTYDAFFTNGVMASLSASAESNILIKASEVGVHDVLLESALPDLKSNGCRIIFWDAEPENTLERLSGNPSDPFLELIPCYDAILSRSKEMAHAEAYGRMGARRHSSADSVGEFTDFLLSLCTPVGSN